MPPLHSAPRLVGISDVSVGFGSPEVLALMHSLAQHYQAEAVLLEPDDIDKPPLRRSPYPGVEIQRLPATFPTYSEPFRIEYISRAAAIVNGLRPEILVFFCTFSLPVLFKLNYRPRVRLYHCYEMVAHYGALDIQMNREAARDLDLITFPEENRARIDTALCGFEKSRKAIVYNCADLAPIRDFTPVPAGERNGRFVYFGTINRRVALSGYFLEPAIQGVPIDLFGRITETTEAGKAEMRAGLRGTLAYQGRVEWDELLARRRRYAYSIVMWNPAISDNHHYAAPNRLFTSIQAGLPCIVAPHPQCKLIVQRYECGLVMRDWSFEAFHDTLRLGQKLYGTSRYADMVANCHTAAAEELNWDTQFDKLRPLLPVL